VKIIYCMLNFRTLKNIRFVTLLSVGHLKLYSYFHLFKPGFLLALQLKIFVKSKNSLFFAKICQSPVFSKWNCKKVLNLSFIIWHDLKSLKRLHLSSLGQISLQNPRKKSSPGSFLWKCVSFCAQIRVRIHANNLQYIVLWKKKSKFTKL
jgi:hypothetical protein